MEYFMVPTQKVPSLQHFRKTEKEVIGGLCRCVCHARFTRHAVPVIIFIFIIIIITVIITIITIKSSAESTAHLAMSVLGNTLGLMCYCVHDPLTRSCGH